MVTRFIIPDARIQRGGLTAGILAFILLLLLPAPAGLSPEGWRLAAVAALMALWWMTEAIPIEATALIPPQASASRPSPSWLPLRSPHPWASCSPPPHRPIAIVFGSGYLTIPDMVKAGFWLDIIAIVVITLAGALLIPLVLG